jgi:diacylglycerol O-acyltransferase / wax synthase
MKSRSGALDTAWLSMETENTPMHLGMLAVFRKPRNAANDYLSDLVIAMRRSGEPAVPWNLRISPGFSLPGSISMVTDKEFDIDYHVRHSALPYPGGERDLGVLISRLQSSRLDPDRPLWECHLIEGLERNRFALYLKVHHALVRDTSAIPIFLSSLGRSASKKGVTPLWTSPPKPDAEESSTVDSGPGTSNDADAAGFGFGNIAVSMKSGIPKSLDRQSRALGVFFSKETPRSTLNRRINYQRRFATQSLKLDRLQRLATEADSTTNELLAYLCGSSLRRFFKEYNALPNRSLVGVMPASPRRNGQWLSGKIVSGLHVKLGTNEADPVARMGAIKKSMSEVRHARSELSEGAASVYAAARSGQVFASQLPVLGGLLPAFFNLAVSHALADSAPRFLAGSRLETIYPISQLIQRSALSIDCVSHGKNLNIGFTGARDTLPHLQRIATYFGQSLDEFEELLAQEGSAL